MRRGIATFVAAFVLLASEPALPSARALTTTSPTGLPGDKVEVMLVTEETGAANGAWAIPAAPHLEFTGVESPPDVPCALTPGGGARCDPSPSGWGAGISVRVRALISADAPAGETSATSTVPGGETAEYTVIVAGPPPVTVDTPADGATVDARPLISGSRRAGHSVVVSTLEGPVCAVPADAATAWQCRPAEPLAPGVRELAVAQRSPAGDASTPVTVTVTVTAPAPAPAPPPAPVPPPAPPPAAPVAVRPRPAPPAVAPPPPPRATPPVVVAPRAEAARPLPLRLAGRSVPVGTVGTLRGTIGPSASAVPVTITVTGALDKGMSYRSVILDPAGRCTLGRATFRCEVGLQPGQTAEIAIRVASDALNAPAAARHRLGASIAGAAGGADSTVSTTLPIAVGTEADDVARQVSTAPGGFLPLLALLLFALAATVAERRRGRTSTRPEGSR